MFVTMTAVQQNVASEIQALAAQLVVLRTRASLLAQRYADEDMASLADGDFAAYPQLAHVTAAEFAAGVYVMGVVVSLLEQNTPPNWARLLKITASVPR